MAAGDSYMLPRNPSEVSRLDLQHYALRETLGVNFLAPVSHPGRILDVGTGTGQWAFELCQAFPEATAVGLDVAATSKSPAPENYRFVRGNLLPGLPFGDARFGFVHQRLLRAGIPAQAWPSVVQDLARVTSPGGWVELVEAVGTELINPGPAAKQLVGLAVRLLDDRQLDAEGGITDRLGDLLESAGLEAVATRPIEIPLGDWGGRAGSFMASNLRSLYVRLAPTFESRLEYPSARTHELIDAMLEEFESEHTAGALEVAWGRKPG